MILTPIESTLPKIKKRKKSFSDRRSPLHKKVQEQFEGF